MLDINRLRGAIYTKHTNVTEFATSLGWTRQRVSMILRGKQRVDVDDARLMADKLGLTDTETIQIFLSR